MKQNSMTDFSVGFWPPSGWAPTWRLHTQSSINLSKLFLLISRRYKKMALTWTLARILRYLSPFIYQNLDYIYWTVLTMIFDGLALKTSNNWFFLLVLIFSQNLGSWSVSCNDVWAGCRKRRVYFCPFASNWIERAYI